MNDPYAIQPDAMSMTLDLTKRAILADSPEECLDIVRDYGKMYPISWHTSMRDTLGMLVQQSIKTGQEHMLHAPLGLVLALATNPVTPSEILFHYGFVEWFSPVLSRNPAIPFLLEMEDEFMVKAMSVFLGPRMMLPLGLGTRIIYSDRFFEWLLQVVKREGGPEEIQNAPRLQKKSPRAKDFSGADFERWHKELLAFDKKIVANRPGHWIRFIHYVSSRNSKIWNDPMSILGSIAGNIRSAPDILRAVSIYGEVANVFGVKLSLHPFSSITEANFTERYMQEFAENRCLSILLSKIGWDTIFEEGDPWITSKLWHILSDPPP